MNISCMLNPAKLHCQSSENRTSCTTLQILSLPHPFPDSSLNSSTLARVTLPHMTQLELLLKRMRQLPAGGRYIWTFRQSVLPDHEQSS